MSRRFEQLMTAAHALRRLYWRALEPQILGVRALILDGPRVMLVRHTYLPGWYLPGGRVDRGEVAERALRREVAEECGLVVESCRLLTVYSNAEVNRNDHILLYAVDSFQKGPPPSRLRRLEIAEARFFDAAALPEEATEATRRRLAEHAASRYVPIW